MSDRMQRALRRLAAVVAEEVAYWDEPARDRDDWDGQRADDKAEAAREGEYRDALAQATTALAESEDGTAREVAENLNGLCYCDDVPPHPCKTCRITDALADAAAGSGARPIPTKEDAARVSEELRARADRVARQMDGQMKLDPDIGDRVVGGLDADR